MVSNVYQLTEEEASRFSSLSNEDVGKWVFLVNGCLHGFYDTKVEALISYKYVTK